MQYIKLSCTCLIAAMLCIEAAPNNKRSWLGALRGDSSHYLHGTCICSHAHVQLHQGEVRSTHVT